MTAINSVTFVHNNDGGDILSQINHVTRSIDKLRTQLIDVSKSGGDSDTKKQLQGKLESQIRTLQTQLMQLEHQQSDKLNQQKQQESRNQQQEKPKNEKGQSDGTQVDTYA